MTYLLFIDASPFETTVAHCGTPEDLLRCGVSARLMTEMGHSRHFEREVGMTASPQ
jgi:hypothetical protein